ncbi:hypothetical protein SAT01_07070 [Sinomonas atrocyanea]|nr:hypothetical protein SAT01_07070 [Sinomonas atrocyanea]GGG69602.1 hypothetical protein GCM10007172_22180 [Sinomonas atrocyanea]
MGAVPCEQILVRQRSTIGPKSFDFASDAPGREGLRDGLGRTEARLSWLSSRTALVRSACRSFMTLRLGAEGRMSRLYHYRGSGESSPMHPDQTEGAKRNMRQE